MNAICRCQAGQKSDHRFKTAGNLANVGSTDLALREQSNDPISKAIATKSSRYPNGWLIRRLWYMPSYVWRGYDSDLPWPRVAETIYDKHEPDKNSLLTFFDTR